MDDILIAVMIGTIGACVLFILAGLQERPKEQQRKVDWGPKMGESVEKTPQQIQAEYDAVMATVSRPTYD